MVRRSLIAAPAFGLLVAAIHLAGVAGYQAGEAVTAVVLAGAAAGLVLWVAPSGSRLRLLALPAAVGALALVAPLHDAAPLSKGRLAAILDELNLPDFEVLTTEPSGHSWCRPECPAVARRYAGPGIAPAGAVVIVASQLVQEDLVEPSEVAARRLTGDLTLRGEDVDVRISATRTGAGAIEIVLRLESRR